MVRHLHHRAMTEGVNNLEARFIASNDPAVPEVSDWVFVCDVLHHVPNRAEWLGKVSKSLKRGAHITCCDSPSLRQLGLTPVPNAT